MQTATNGEKHNNGARGIAYEPYALAVHARAHPDRVVFGGQGGIPDALLARASGTPVTAEALKKLKREYAATVEAALTQGQKPVGLSEHFGLDGVSVDAKAWKTHTGDVLASLNVIEAKVCIADCHVLGPSIARCYKNLAIYGPEKVPPLTVLSPYKPTSKVIDTFSPLKGAFHHERIEEETPRAVSSMPSTSAVEITEDRPIDPYQWQKTVSRNTTGMWNKGSRICVANVVMGLGKTAAGWLTLQKADRQPLRLFCAHTAVVALQAMDEATRLGVTALDLTHRNKTKSGVDAAVHVTTDFSSDSSSEDGSDDGEAGDEEHEPAAAECARLIQKITDLSQAARADNPV